MPRKKDNGPTLLARIAELQALVATLQDRVVALERSVYKTESSHVYEGKRAKLYISTPGSENWRLLGEVKSFEFKPFSPYDPRSESEMRATLAEPITVTIP